jgi:integrase
MLGSNHPNQISVPQEKTMRRRRYQKGSLQARRHGKKRVWIVQYYDAEGHHRYHTIGRMADFTKSRAEEEQAAFMRTINGGDGKPMEVRPVLVAEFVNQVYLPFQRGKRKKSTKGTSENRIQFHIVGDLGNCQLESFTPTGLQAYLEGKAATHGFSMVDHLRWDLTSICDFAVAEKVLATNPAKELYTPSTAKKGACPVMTAFDVERALGAVEFREKVILHLAIFSGFRPGEMLAIQRRNVSPDGRSVEIEQRVYRGDLDVPKNGETRSVSVPPRTSALLVEWLSAAVDPEPTAWVFASENRETPLWRDNLLRRHIRPALAKVNLGWVDFKVMRRTNASLGHHAKVDPKVSADNRGHGIGVSLDVYTKSSIGQKAVAVKKLEDSVLGPKIVRMPRKKAS